MHLYSSVRIVLSDYRIRKNFDVLQIDAIFHKRERERGRGEEKKCIQSYPIIFLIHVLVYFYSRTIIHRISKRNFMQEYREIRTDLMRLELEKKKKKKKIEGKKKYSTRSSLQIFAQTLIGRDTPRDACLVCILCPFSLSLSLFFFFLFFPIFIGFLFSMQDTCRHFEDAGLRGYQLRSAAATLKRYICEYILI